MSAIHRLAMGALAPFVALVLAAPPLAAEVVEVSGNGFSTRDEALVSASPKDVWLLLISPAKYWVKAHTWSGDSANLSLRPQAGGCFCEKIPEDPDPTRITLEGSVEHMRVIQAFPEKALRMRGGLGPLQSEPATGVLTIAISKSDAGTRIVWEYVVGGPMRYEIPVIAKAVDAVMTQQLDSLAAKLGRLDKAEELDGGLADENPAADEPEASNSEEESGEEQGEKALPVSGETSLEDAIDAMAKKDDSPQ